jgi:hypothetical protein
MAKDEIVWLRENWTAEENRQYEEDVARWRAEHPSPQDLQDRANRALIEIRDSLVGTATVPEFPKPDKGTLAENRLAMLVQWETATGEKRSHLYSRSRASMYGLVSKAWAAATLRKEAEGSSGRPGSGGPIISKNRYYAWKNGDLSRFAKDAQRLETFLAAHTQSVDGSKLSPEKNP